MSRSSIKITNLSKRESNAEYNAGISFDVDDDIVKTEKKNEIIFNFILKF